MCPLARRGARPASLFFFKAAKESNKNGGRSRINLLLPGLVTGRLYYFLTGFHQVSRSAWILSPAC
jgi:hypothetical protein